LNKQEKKSAGRLNRPIKKRARFCFRRLIVESLETRYALANDLVAGEIASDLISNSLDRPTGDSVYAPGTSWEYIAERSDLRGNGDPSLQFQFSDSNRWSSTATNGGGLVQGDPTTLTWSFVRNGVNIPGFNGEPASASNLVSFLGGIYGVTTNDTNFADEPWFNLFNSYLNRWAEVTGLQYVYEPNDDGATFGSGSPGVLGVRGDTRISGHFIDGNSNILAYNFFPNGGDMVIDTGDNFYSNNLANNSRALRNVLSHENGHGIGISHVCPVIGGVNGRLMEPFINLSIEGPQFDDILAAQRGYGDASEKSGGNNSVATATNLGNLSANQTILRGTNANDVQVVPAEVDFVSIDDDSDLDFFRFTVAAGISVNIQLTPMGPTYLSGPQNANGSCSAGTNFNAAAQSDLTLQYIAADGTTVLQTSNLTGLQGVETITTGTLAAGSYFVRVSGSANAAQFYRLSLAGVQATGVFVSPSGGSTQVREGGATDSYTLQLSSVPAGSVQISVVADSQTQVSANGVDYFGSLSLNFVDASPRTLTVRAIDDAIIEGPHSGTITHAITATGDSTLFPLNLSIDSIAVSIADNELPSLVRQPTLGGLVGTSFGNAGVLTSGSDAFTYGITLEAGQKISVSTIPLSASVILGIQVVGLTGVSLAPSAGASAVLPPTSVLTSGYYTLRVTGTAATSFNLDFFLNSLTEAVDSTIAAPLDLTSSSLSIGAGRFAVIGQSTAASSTLQFAPKVNNPELFVDIATTGTALNLADDDIVNVITTVGNASFPAGVARISNNGVVLNGTAGTVAFTNAALPTSAFTRALVPFWDDLDDQSGNVFWQERLVGGINTLIVQWENRPHFDFGGNTTFQVQVFALGLIQARYVYKDVSFGDANVNGGASATVGYQSSTTTAIPFSFNIASLVDGDVLDLVLPATADVDSYLLDLNGQAGRTIDIVLAGIGSDFSGQTLQLIAPDGTTVLATGTTEPLQSGVNPINQDLAILGFVVPSNGIFSIRASTAISNGRYNLVVTNSVLIDTEPNSLATDTLRTISTSNSALGSLGAADQDDFYQFVLAANTIIRLQTSTPFDSSSSPLLNSLNPELLVLHPDGTTIIGSDTNSLDGKNARLTFRAQAAGTYKVRLRATSGSGEYVLTLTEVPPVVTSDILVNATTWAPLFRDYVDGGFNDNSARGYLIPTGSTRTIPWTNLNQIRVRFSADVGASLDPTDFALIGQDGFDAGFLPGVVPAISSVSFDSSSSIATLSLSTAIGPNIIYLNIIAAGIVSFDGVPMTANRQVKFYVLPSDTDGVRTGAQYTVNSVDLAIVRNTQTGFIFDDPNSTSADGPYFGYIPEADLDGSGTILSNDFARSRSDQTSFIVDVSPPPFLQAPPVKINDRKSTPSSPVSTAIESRDNVFSEFGKKLETELKTSHSLLKRLFSIGRRRI